MLKDELAQPRHAGDMCLSVGVFDGVHLGHRHLLERLTDEASKAGCGAGVVTFRNHPRPVLNPEATVSSLTTLDERTRLLQDLGVNLVVPITFTLEVSRVTAREFVGLLMEHLSMRVMVVGPDFALGHRREGTPEVLSELGREMGFTIIVADTYAPGGARVRSSAIRDALTEGKVARAAEYLGRYYAVIGEVVHGAGRGGSTLGYPTANVAAHTNLAVPGNGIYATWAYVDGERYQAATSIGVRPTFGVGERAIEAFLLDYEGDLYHKAMRLEFVEHIRDEVAFESADALRRQIDLDVEETRRILVTGG